MLALGGLATRTATASSRPWPTSARPARGILGPWGHAWPHAGAPGPTIDGVGLMRRVAGQRVAVDLKVDPALIGGLVVKVGSRMVDSSLKTKLQRLQLAMKGVG